MQWFYLLGLLIGIAGMAILDWRYKLAFWSDARRTAFTLAAAIGIFIVWDFLGIWLGIFFHGGSQFSLPFRIAPEFPIEELFFLFLLSYCALVIFNGAKKWLTRT